VTSTPRRSLEKRKEMGKEKEKKRRRRKNNSQDVVGEEVPAPTGDVCFMIALIKLLQNSF